MNRIILTGNMVRDNKSLNKENQDYIVSNAIAVRREFKNPKGEYETDFFDIIAFGHQAKYMMEYINKGDKVELAGRMQTRTFTATDGTQRKAYEIVVDYISSLGSKETKGSELTPAPADDDFIDDTDEEELPF